MYTNRSSTPTSSTAIPTLFDVFVIPLPLLPGSRPFIGVSQPGRKRAMGAPNSGGRRTAALAASVLLFAEHRFRSYCGAFTLVPTGRPWALQNASLGARAITASLLVDNGRRRVLRPTELTHKALSLTSAAANLVESRDYGVTATGSKTVHVARGKARLFWQDSRVMDKKL